MIWNVYINISDDMDVILWFAQGQTNSQLTLTQGWGYDGLMYQTLSRQKSKCFQCLIHAARVPDQPRSSF